MDADSQPKNPKTPTYNALSDAARGAIDYAVNLKLKEGTGDNIDQTRLQEQFAIDFVRDPKKAEAMLDNYEHALDVADQQAQQALTIAKQRHTIIVCDREMLNNLGDPDPNPKHGLSESCTRSDASTQRTP